ncbi:MAG: glycosyltransferase family 2 protein [Candidatus Omnitrophica bacterium]|nr:glycosyltransferase family 2 protein [Candidatus Omnitrophota bacterium]MDD5435957.1 glycosyltransferase family 2 protein [Candidatus Omnitrophota bacterium]
MKENSCDIIMPVWNEPDVTRECVDSIVEHTRYPYRLVIIDNASDAPTKEYLLSLNGRADVKAEIIRNEENLGFVKAVNQGIRFSDAPYICIMNNDTVATEGWLETMVAAMEGHKDVGLINPTSNTFSHDPDAGETIDQYAAKLRRFTNKVQELHCCRFFCTVIKREVLEKLGPLDEIYHLGYFDDTDYCKRAQGLGYRTARAKGAYVYHKENTSFKKLRDNSALFKANEKIFLERWGRHVRVGYFLDKIRSKEKINEVAVEAARSGHQIFLFIKKGLEWPVGLDHYDIVRVDVNPHLFGIVSIYKILKRKKKKGIEVLLTDSPLFGAVLNLTRFLHGSDVFVNVRKEALMDRLKERSKIF